MRARASLIAWTLALCALAGSAAGQSASSSADAPAPPAEAMDARGLPPGHPPIDGQDASANTPELGGAVDDASLPEGTLLVQAQGLAPAVLQALEATLFEIRREKDETTTHAKGTQHLDASGSTRFTGVSQPRGVLYRVVVQHEGVPYASSTFKLNQGAGKKVPVRVFDITTDIDRARIGVQAVAYVEPRDHYLHVEQLFRFANLSDTTWRGNTLPVRLPARAEGFATSEKPGPLEVSAVPGQGAIIRGVVPPGTAEVTFEYQLPYPHDDHVEFELGMPPRVGAVRVLAAVGPGLGLHVDGLQPALPSRADNGQLLLVANGAVAPGGDQIETLRVTLNGLPSGGRARWIALTITVITMLGGLGAAFHWSKNTSPPPRSNAKTSAQREAILEALAKLEERKRKEELDEDRYEVERDVLLDRLARSLADLSPKPESKSQRSDKRS